LVIYIEDIVADELAESEPIGTGASNKSFSMIFIHV